VRALLRRTGAAPRPARVLQVRALRLDLDTHQAEQAGRALELTPTEFGVLQALLAAPGHAFTRTELIDHALGDHFDGLDRTLDSHIKNLRKKIERVPDEPSEIETVFGVGYRLRAEDDPPP